VIQPALKEVNAVTDLALSIEVKREARQVAEIRFLIGNNPQQCIPIEPPRERSDGLKPLRPSTASGTDTVAECDKSAAIASNAGNVNEHDPESIAPALEGDGSNAGPNPILARLQNEFCLSARVAARVCSANPEAAIQGAMDYVLSRYNAGKVKDIGPYFLAALKEGAAIRRSELETNREAEAKARQTAREKREAQRREQAQAEMMWNQSLLAHFEALPEDDRQDVLEKFLAWLSTSKHKQNIVGIFQRGGLTHPWAKAEFLSYLGTLGI